MSLYDYGYTCEGEPTPKPTYEHKPSSSFSHSQGQSLLMSLRVTGTCNAGGAAPSSIGGGGRRRGCAHVVSA